MAANARLAMFGGGSYLLAHIDPATPDDLAAAAKSFANGLQDIAVYALAECPTSKQLKLLGCATPSRRATGSRNSASDSPLGCAAMNEIGDSVKTALDHWEKREWNAAMADACAAVDATAKERYPSLGVAKRFRKVVRSSLDIFGVMALPVLSSRTCASRSGSSRISRTNARHGRHPLSDSPSLARSR